MCNRAEYRDLRQQYVDMLPLGYSVRRVWWPIHGRQILRIEQATLPPAMQATESQLRYAFRARRRLGLLLYHYDQPVGYVLGIPLESPRCLYDPAKDPIEFYGRRDTVYIQSIGIVPAYRGAGGFQYLIAEFGRQCRQMGYKNCVAHVRHSNGVAAFARRRMRFEQLAIFENWQNTGERFDYMLLRIEHNYPCPRWLYVWLNLQRRYRRFRHQEDDRKNLLNTP